MTTRIPVALTLVLAVFVSAAAGEAPPLADFERLSFLVGSWESASATSSSEEHWLPPKGGVMLGLHRTVRGESAFFEYLRIESSTDGILTYVANPMGRPGAFFRLIEVGERRAVFVREGDDFPRRIVYRLDDDGVLHARIEGEDGGKPRAEEWRWKRAEAPSPAASADCSPPCSPPDRGRAPFDTPLPPLRRVRRGSTPSRGS